MDVEENDIFLARDFGLHSGFVGRVISASDGSFIVTYGTDRTIRVYDPIGRREMRVLRANIGNGGEGDIFDMALSGDNKYLFCMVRYPNGRGEFEARLRIFDIENGTLLYVVGSWQMNVRILFTPDDLYFVIVDRAKKTLSLYLAPMWIPLLITKALLVKIGSENKADSLSELPFTPMKVIHYDQLELGDHFWESRHPHNVVISKRKDGEYRIFTTFWDLRNYQSVMSIHDVSIYGSLPKHIHTIQLPQGLPTSLAISYSHIACARQGGQPHHGNSIEIYNHDGEHLKSIPDTATVPFCGLAYTPDSAYLLVGRANGGLSSLVFDVYNSDGHLSYHLMSRFDQHRGDIGVVVSFLNKHTAVGVGGDENKIYFWDPKNGRERGQIVGKARVADVSSIGIANRAASSAHDLPFIALQYANESNNGLGDGLPFDQVFDFNQMDLRPYWEIKDNVQFKPLGETAGPYSTAVLGFPYRNYYLLRKRDDGETDQSLITMGRYGWINIAILRFIDEGHLLCGTVSGEIFLFKILANSDSAYIYRTAILSDGHTGAIRHLARSGDFLLSYGADQTLIIWNIGEFLALSQTLEEDQLPHDRRIKPLLKLIVTDTGEWVVWSTMGFYDASLDGDKLLGYHVNESRNGLEAAARFVPYDRFAHVLHRPDIIQKLVETGDVHQMISTFRLSTVDIESILPPTVYLQSNENRITVDGDTAELTFRVENSRDEPLSKVWILDLAVPVWSWDASKPDGVNPEDDLIIFENVRVPVTPGKNELRILAKTDVSKSTPLGVEVYSKLSFSGRDAQGGGDGQPAQPTLELIKPNIYAVIVGVSKYKSTGILNLKYADDDARGLNTALKNLQPLGYGEIETTLLTDQEVTKQGIVDALLEMEQKIIARAKYKKENQKVARDITIVYLSGHGETHANGRFYFLCHDTKRASVPTTALDLMSMGEIVNRLEAEVLILTDACHSGQLSKNINNRELIKAWNNISDRAQVIFSATTANKKSWEHKSWGYRERPRDGKSEGHGAFTRSLLDALNAPGHRWLFELFNEVALSVMIKTNPLGAGKDIVGHMQVPTLSIQGGMKNLPIR